MGWMIIEKLCRYSDVVTDCDCGSVGLCAGEGGRGGRARAFEDGFEFDRDIDDAGVVAC